MSDYEIISKLDEELKHGKRAVLITVIYKEGSGPREPGSKMLVTSEGDTLGTIGGGGIERILVKEALGSLRKGKPKVLHFAMGVPARKGMIKVDSKCGGEVKIFLDVIKPMTRLIIMGSGLIAQAVARYANDCGFHTIIVDDADTATSKLFPTSEIINESYPGSLHKLEAKPSDFILMLHGDTNFEINGLRYAINVKPFFIGLLGSSNKLKEHKKQLRKEGYSPELIDKIVGPVGIDIRAETPEEIGISIVAQLIKTRLD